MLVADSKGSLVGKTLLILGGNPETGALVDVANELGVHTIVVDPDPKAPAKRRSREHYEIDGFDVQGIVHLARRRQVDGVLVGVADILVRPYSEVCAELDLPCYAPRAAVDAFCSKDGFRVASAHFGVRDIPGVVLDEVQPAEAVENLDYPVMVKPVDNGGGVGMHICADPSQLAEQLRASYTHSRTGRLLVERYMDCDDMFAYYTFVEGEAFLSATADRFTTRAQPGASPVCIAARYPSEHTEAFVEKVHPSLVRMFEGLGVRNGVLNLQFFVDQGQFYSYDPGFRLQGEAPHIYLSAINGFDHREMLINFALTGLMGVSDFPLRNDYLLRGHHACTLWVLLRSGVVDRIDGLGYIRDDPTVVFVQQRMREGDFVTAEMTGTERQVLARIYVIAETPEELAEKARDFQEELRVTDQHGHDMVLDWVDAAKLRKS